MAFDIYLPAARIAAQRKLWSNRLPIEDLDDAVRGAPERTAFVERVDKIAAGLVELGVGKGDVVAFQLPNWWEFTALFYACNRVGAVANPLMPIFRQRELRFMMRFAEAKVAVVPALWRNCVMSSPWAARAMSRSSAPSSTTPPHPRRSGGSSRSCGPSPTRWWS